MAVQIIDSIFKIKRGTAQRWREVNPILEAGEPGFEYDTNRLKIGNGLAKWNELDYIGIENITGQEEIITVQEFSQLPVEGKIEKLYRVTNNKLLYQWNNNKYEALGGGGSFDPSIITLINGGNANG